MSLTSLLFYNSFYIRVKRLIITLLYNHVVQHILNAYFLDTSCGWSEHQPHTFTIIDGSISISFFSVLFIELQEQHSYLNYPYKVIFRGI